MSNLPTLSLSSRFRVARRLVADGIFKSNPIIAGNLGICSALAATVDLKSAVLMSVTVTAVLTVSALVVSAVRVLIPDRVRLVVHMIMISSLVTVAALVSEAWFPKVHGPIGPYLALVVTNCVILGRIESFSRLNGPLFALGDAIGNSLGYSLVLIAVAALRQMFSAPWLAGDFAIHPAGGFLALAGILWAGTALIKRTER